MLMPDPSIKPPVDTGNKTVSGRTIWYDPDREEDYSERSTTFEIDGKYYTMPTVSEDGRQYTTDNIKKYVIENGPIDYLTGEELPVFKSEDDAIDYAIKRSSTRKQTDMARGGIMNDQMRMFEEGGIADDGMNRDPISGNEIPSGSLAKEVRDDIPAQLSEGEYVVPADVVRFFGVKYFEDLRMEAKIGLQKMEQDGRIGGEPITDMPSSSEQDMPEGLDDPGLSPEDLKNLEAMMSGNVDVTGAAIMNEGGLLDKVEYMAKNDPLVNQLLNAGGVVVGFAGGGMARSISGDPKEVDAILNKFMALTKENPSMMDKLATRGIKVNRTEADQKPKEMQARNSPVQTTNPVTNTEQPVDQMAPPPSMPQPVKAALGTYLPGSEAFATSPTRVPGQFNSLGGSLIYQGATKLPSTTNIGVAAPATPGVVGGGLGSAASAGSNIACPAGQERNANGVCVPIKNQDYDGSKKNGSPEPKDYTPFVKKYGETDWSDPKAYETFITDFGTPLTDKEKENNLTGFGIVGSVIGAISPAAEEVNKYSQLQVAKIIAQGRGDTAALAQVQGAMDAFLGSSGKFVNATKGWLPDTGGYINALYGNALKLAKLDVNKIGTNEWTEEDQDAFKKITGGSKKSSVVVKAPVVEKTPTRKSPVKQTFDTSSGGSTRASIVKKQKDRSDQKADAAKAAKKAGDAKIAKAKKENPTGAIATSKKIQKTLRSSKDELESKYGQLNKGGLMKRNKIK